MAGKLKVLLVSADNPKDKKAWSGTKFSLYQQLLKYYDVDILVVNSRWGKRLDRVRMLATTFGRQYTQFGLLNSYLCSRQVRRKLGTGLYDAAFVFDCTSIPFLQAKTPVVYFTDTTTHLMQHYYWNFKWPLSWEADLIQWFCLKKCNMVLAASTWAIDDMTAYFRIPPEKCRLCRLGANVKVEDKCSVKANDAVNLVFVGADWIRKGGDITLEAFRRLKAMDGSRDYRLHVIGSKPNEEMLDDGARFYGFLDRNISEQENLHAKIFQEGDIFILPTKAECAGIVFCEASAYGLPIVTYDTGGVGDYVVNGVNGFRLPVEAAGEMFANCILKIVSDTSLYQRLSDGGRKLYAECLNWDKAGHVLKDTVDSLCE